MPSHLKLCLATLTLLLLPQLRAAEDLDVVSTTDMTAEGAALGNASPGNPVYYQSMDLGYKDLGTSRSGEKPPASVTMNEVMQKVLAKQGYLPATKEHPATQVITWYWGTLNVEREYGADPSLPATQLNLNRMLAFLGGGKLGMLRDSHEGSYEKATRAMRANFENARDPILYDLAGRDLYVIAVGSYTIDSVRKGTPLLLWNTRIATAAHGHDMAVVVPKMAILAAPTIARASDKPVWTGVDERLKGEVSIGEISVGDQNEPAGKTQTKK